MFEQIVANISDLSLPITLQQYEWAEISQGVISEGLIRRIAHQANVQISEHLGHLSLSEKSSLLQLSGWKFVETEFLSESAICVYHYQKVVDGMTYKTKIHAEQELLPAT